MVILQYLIAILGFSVIILVHEFGHFIFAKVSGMHVLEFFIGFGPKILKFKAKKSGTLYGISAIPLGGYNKILGMDRNEKIQDELKEKVFYSKPFLKKFLVISGGGIFNILFAIFLIMIYLSMGILAPTSTVDYIEPGSPAERYGFYAGDRIIALNDSSISSWDDMAMLTRQYPGKDVVYTIVRDNNELDINVTLDDKQGSGYLGVGPKLEKTYLSFFNVLKEGFKMTWDISYTYFKLFGQLFTGQIPFSQARPVSPVGVVSIFQQSAAMGVQNFILFVALVSLLLAFGNFLPILPVDGGHLVVIIYEAIRKKSFPKKAMDIYNALGIALVASLFIIGLIFDIINPFKIANM
ncbi:MAG: Zinc metalloprotease Rip1 [Actinobacteria bacterium ADurb.Bin346]|nr:MAG: Zinc metalloprotease Rip1 [Actinobacteria bacterium ADurb.Bin346]